MLVAVSIRLRLDARFLLSVVGTITHCPIARLNASWIAHGYRTLRSKRADLGAAWCATHPLGRQCGHSAVDREGGRAFASGKRRNQAVWDHRSRAAPRPNRARRRCRSPCSRRGISTGKSDTLRQDTCHKLVARVTRSLQLKMLHRGDGAQLVRTGSRRRSGPCGPRT